MRVLRELLASEEAYVENLRVLVEVRLLSLMLACMMSFIAGFHEATRSIGENQNTPTNDGRRH